MAIPIPHIPDELQKGVSVVIQTKYGPVKGGRTTNGAAVFLGKIIIQIRHSTQANSDTKRCLMRCLLSALRTQSLCLLITVMKIRILYARPNVRHTVRRFLVIHPKTESR